MARAAISTSLRTKPLAGLLAIAAVVVMGAACDRASQPPQPRADASASRMASSESPRPAAVQDEAKPDQAPPASSADAPAKEMTREEESKTMPQPGQANDHSTLVKDPKR